eukprot:g12116.t1
MPSSSSGPSPGPTLLASATEKKASPAQNKPARASLLRELFAQGANPNLYSNEDAGRKRPLLNLAIEEAAKLSNSRQHDAKSRRAWLHRFSGAAKRWSESWFFSGTSLASPSRTQALPPEFETVELILRQPSTDPGLRAEETSLGTSTTRDGENALDLAIRFDLAPLARAILRKKPELVNATRAKTGVAPLHTACFNGQAEMALLLLLFGANPNACDRFQQTPLFFAASDGVVDLLLRHKADYLHLSSPRSQSALHVLAMNGHAGALQRLLTRMDDGSASLLVNLPDKNGLSALHLAARAGEEPACGVLLDFGAEVKNNGTHNNSRPNPIQYAERHGQTDTAYYLHTRYSGSGRASWGEKLQNPVVAMCAVILLLAALLQGGAVWRLLVE